uniref:Uncharacterized protein n=1 Tax=Glossina palpalis gambiensis TaxID=67801 RepID=A0A1B0C5D0_9MUSC
MKWKTHYAHMHICATKGKEEKDATIDDNNEDDEVAVTFRCCCFCYFFAHRTPLPPLLRKIFKFIFCKIFCLQHVAKHSLPHPTHASNTHLTNNQAKRRPILPTIYLLTRVINIILKPFREILGPDADNASHSIGSYVQIQKNRQLFTISEEVY